MKKPFYTFFLLIFFLYCPILNAAVKGSMSAVSIEPFFTFPAADSDNVIQGFGWFKNGFSLEDNTTTCTFESIYPVSGPVDLNGGTLHLLEDLIFKNVTTLQGLGTIVGNSHLLELSTTITHIPLDSERFENVHLALSNNVTIKGSAMFADSVVFDGRGHTVELEGIGEIVVASNATLHMKNMLIKGIGGDNIRCVDDTAELILDSVKWIQDTNFTFSLGTLAINDKVEFIGATEFKHTSNKPITIKEKSIWVLLAGIGLTIGKRPTVGAVEPLIFTNASSTLKLSNCSLLITDSGWQATKGKIIFDEEVEIDIFSTDTTNGLMFGDGIDSANDIRLRMNAGVSIKHSGHSVCNNIDPNKWNVLAKNAKILRELNSNIYMAQDITMPPMTFESVSNSVPPIQCADDVVITYQDNQIILPAVAFDISGKQTRSDAFCLHGLDEIFFAKGSLPLDLHVSGTGNLMHGNGGISGIIKLQDPATQLNIDMQGAVNQPPQLNGGTLTLNSDLILGPGVLFTGFGFIDLTTCQLHLGAKDLTWTSTLDWQGSDGSIDMRAQISLRATWTIKGRVTINGNDNTLDLGTQGEIIIAPGATLRCKNMRLTGISESNIRCADDTASLILEDVIWVQDGDYSFAAGSISFKDAVDFLGSYTFKYETTQTSTIQIKSEWHISNKMRFEIGKDPAGSVWPLECIDNSSVLHLDDCSFVVTGSGFQMIKGCVAYSRDVNIEIESIGFSGGIFLGNGIVEDDPVIQFNPGSTSRFKKGHLVWDIVDDKNLSSNSTTVRMIRTKDSLFHIKQNLTLTNFTVDADALAITMVDTGKTLSYDKCLFALPNGQMEFTGDRYNAVTSLLSGNDLLFLHYGIMPMATFVLGTNNHLEGNGSITGPIVLLAPTAALHFNLGGILESNIILGGGTITLDGNLTLAKDAVITTDGAVDLGIHSIDLSGNDTVWTSTLIWDAQNATMGLHATTHLSGQWIFNGNCTIHGNGNALDLSQGGSLIINDGVQVKLRDVRLTGISTGSIVMMGAASSLILDDMLWVQEGDLTISNGSIYIVDTVDFNGPYTFALDTSSTSTIGFKSTWHITDSMQLSIGRTGTAAAEPLYFEDDSSTLCLDNCSLQSTQYGLQLTRGRVVCSRDVDIDILSTDTSNGLQLGDGTSNGNMIFEFNPGATVSFLSGNVIYNVTLPDSVISRSTTAKLVRSVTSIFDINQDITLSNLTIEASFYATTNILEGKIFDYVNCVLLLPTGSVIVNAQRYNPITNLLAGDDSLFLISGLMPMYTVINGINNNILGNGSLVGPVTLLGPTADVTLSVDGTVNESITLNGGTIKLGQDLNFACEKVVADSGIVDLGSNRMRICSDEVIWTGTIDWVSNNSTIAIDSDVQLSGLWTFSGNCSLQGNGNVLNLTPGGSIVIDSGSTLKLRNVRIRGISGANISCVDDTSMLVLDQVSWVQDGDVTFANGSICFIDTVDFVGSHTFVYKSKKASSIEEKSSWHITQGMRLEIGKQPELEAENPLLFADSTSALHLDNCSFIVTDSGWQLLKGCIRYSRDVTVDVLSTDTGNGVVLGDGTVANDPIVQFDPGANARFVRGHLVFDVVSINNIRSDSTTVSMIRLADSFFYIAQNIVLKNFTVDASALASTILAPGITFDYENCVVMLPDGLVEVTAQRYDAVSNMLVNNDLLFMRYGVMPMATIVQGANNKIAGNGDISGPIIFLGPTAALSCDLRGSIASNVTLNGGMLTLQSDLKFADDAVIATAGTVDLDSSQLSLGSKDTVWTSTVAWQAQDATIELKAKTSLQGNWIFNGDCTIQGNGNVLDLGKVGQIMIGAGVKLTLRDMRLTGIVDNCIQWLGEDSVLFLDDVMWVQDGDFTLDQGSIYFQEIVDFTGPYTFVVDTNSTSTIGIKSFWNISDSMQLSIGRTTTLGPEPLYFEDDSSTLCLDNCTFNATQHGLQLTKGRVVCLGDVAIDIQSTDTTNGIQLGDGTPTGNMIFEFNQGANVSFLSGHVVYDVTIPDSVLSHSTTAKLIRLAGSTFYINQDIILKNLTIDASLYATTGIADGKAFGYENCMLILPGGSIIANAQRYNAFTNWLQGNQSIFLATGSYPMFTLVSGIGNNIVGNGTVTGEISLLNSGAEVTLSVDGLISKNVILNGGTVHVGQDLNFVCSKHFEGDGTIDLSGNRVNFGPKDHIWTGTILWEGYGGQIDFNADTALSGKWTFSDNCVLHCHGNTIDLSSGGEIIVHDDSTLRIRDVQIEGISGTNIRCLNDQGNLILEDVLWIQDDNYQFTRGSLQWKHENEMRGESSFAYQTNQTSTIWERSRLILDTGFTFSYDPIVTTTLITAEDLLDFEDATAQLVLDGATLYATTTGLHLTKGSLVIQGNSELASSITTIIDEDNLELELNGGITLGSGIAADDMVCLLANGVTLKVSEGTLFYKNVLSSSWQMANQLATLRMATNTQLHLHKSIDLGSGLLLFEDTALFGRVPGATVTGAVDVLGDVGYLSLAES